jgi:predicted nucleic acid-binding protein
MDSAFWDSSALVPLCLQQRFSPSVQKLIAKYDVVAWWATPVEARSAFARELRAGTLSPLEYQQALQKFAVIREGWHEIQPAEELRQVAEAMLERYQLRGADALQLAAAYLWSSGRPFERHFISCDKRLLDAAREAGFVVIPL